MTHPIWDRAMLGFSRIPERMVHVAGFSPMSILPLGESQEVGTPSGRNQGCFPGLAMIPTAAVQSGYLIVWLARWGFFGSSGGPQGQTPPTPFAVLWLSPRLQVSRVEGPRRTSATPPIRDHANDTARMGLQIGMHHRLRNTSPRLQSPGDIPSLDVEFPTSRSQILPPGSQGGFNTTAAISHPSPFPPFPGGRAERFTSTPPTMGGPS